MSGAANQSNITMAKLRQQYDAAMMSSLSGIASRPLTDVEKRLRRMQSMPTKSNIFPEVYISVSNTTVRKICVNCVYHEYQSIEYWGPLRTIKKGEHYCTHPSASDVVTGKSHRTCHDCRADNAGAHGCGKQGAWFTEAKNRSSQSTVDFHNTSKVFGAKIF